MDLGTAAAAGARQAWVESASIGRLLLFNFCLSASHAAAAALTPHSIPQVVKVVLSTRVRAHTRTSSHAKVVKVALPLACARMHAAAA